jgi:hypothetical protein
MRARTSQKFGVALDAGAAEVGDGDAAAVDGREGEQVAGGGGVGLDGVVAGLQRDGDDGVDLVGGGPVGVAAELAEDVEGHVDVGAGRGALLEDDAGRALGEGGGEDEGRDELRARRAGQADLSAAEAGAVDLDRKGLVVRPRPRMSAPWSRRAWRRPSIGRSRMRGVPSTRLTSGEAASTAVRKRAAVPAVATSIGRSGSPRLRWAGRRRR